MRMFKESIGVMRCLFIAVVLLAGLMCGSARAGVADIIQSIPNLKQGVAYSVADARFNYLATTDVFTKWGANFELGYAGVAKSTGDKLVAVLSYDLVNLKNMGVTIPVLDLIAFRPGVYVGSGRLFGSDEWDYGVSATVLDLKW